MADFVKVERKEKQIAGEIVRLLQGKKVTVGEANSILIRVTDMIKWSNLNVSESTFQSGGVPEPLKLKR